MSLPVLIVFNLVQMALVIGSAIALHRDKPMEACYGMLFAILLQLIEMTARKAKN